MQSYREVHYRLRLAEGFLAEAQQDVTLRRWRSCVDNSQLAVENAAKVALALLGPVGRTHNPAVPLRQALSTGSFAPALQQRVELLAELAELLGPDLHAESDYGDESTGQTPWEMFDEGDAQRSLDLAQDAVTLAKTLKELASP